MPSKQSTLRGLISAAILSAVALAWLANPQARAATAAATAVAASARADTNAYLWLAQIHDRKALAWAEAQSGHSDLALEGDPTYARDRSQILDVLNANTRIPEGALDHGRVLN